MAKIQITIQYDAKMDDYGPHTTTQYQAAGDDCENLEDGALSILDLMECANHVEFEPIEEEDD